MHSGQNKYYPGTLNRARHYLVLFTAFFVITFLVYLPTLHAKFVFDFINMVFDIKTHTGLFDFSKGILFDFVNRFVFKSWLHLFGFNVWAWHFLQCFLHSLNGILLYAFIGYLLRQFNYAQWRAISLLATLCFLLNPYHTEPLVWGGDLNYLLVANFILLNLLTFAFYLQSHQTRYLVIAQSAMVAGAFTHELGWFILPADVILALFLAPSLSFVFSKNNLKFWLVSLVVMTGYFVNKLLSGNLLGHYGSSVHLNFKLTEMVQAFCQYLIKILLLGGFLPFKYISRLYGCIGKPSVAYMLLAGLLLCAVILKPLIAKRPGLKVSVGLFMLFVLFVFPVINLYFPFWIKIQGDRYCYVTSAFLIAACIILLYNLKPAVAFLFSIAYLAGSVYFLAFNIQSWHQAGCISQQLEKDYRWQKAPHVYILNLPDNYRGAYIYRSLQPSAFAASFIKDTAAMPDGTKITEVLAYNLNAQTDSVNVTRLDSAQLQVTLSTWGGWWWRDTKGATDYQDSLVAVHVDEYSHSYTVKFKQKQPGEVFLYCANGRWREVPNF